MNVNCNRGITEEFMRRKAAAAEAEFIEYRRFEAAKAALAALPVTTWEPEVAAREAVKIADALLAELARSTGERVES